MVLALPWGEGPTLVLALDVAALPQQKTSFAKMPIHTSVLSFPFNLLTQLPPSLPPSLHPSPPSLPPSLYPSPPSLLPPLPFPLFVSPPSLHLSPFVYLSPLLLSLPPSLPLLPPHHTHLISRPREHAVPTRGCT